jgi:hypothetical protein
MTDCTRHDVTDLPITPGSAYDVTFSNMPPQLVNTIESAMIAAVDDCWCAPDRIDAVLGHPVAPMLIVAAILTAMRTHSPNGQNVYFDVPDGMADHRKSGRIIAEFVNQIVVARGVPEITAVWVAVGRRLLKASDTNRRKTLQTAIKIHVANHQEAKITERSS